MYNEIKFIPYIDKYNFLWYYWQKYTQDKIEMHSKIADENTGRYIRIIIPVFVCRF